MEPFEILINRTFYQIGSKSCHKSRGSGIFHNLVEDFVNSRWISGTRDDLVSLQFKNIHVNSEMTKITAEFKRITTRLDIAKGFRMKRLMIIEYLILKVIT